jgi:sulfur-carrier protein
MKINYLTWLRNRIGCAMEEISLPEGVETISDLLDFLEKKGQGYKSAFSERNLVYASKDNALCSHDEKIMDRDEISLFSPIVGG